MVIGALLFGNQIQHPQDFQIIVIQNAIQLVINGLEKIYAEFIECGKCRLFLFRRCGGQCVQILVVAQGIPR